MVEVAPRLAARADFDPTMRPAHDAFPRSLTESVCLQNGRAEPSPVSSRLERPVVRDRLSNESTRARSLLRSRGSTKCASVARCIFWGRNGRSPCVFPYTMSAPPGISGRVAPGPTCSRASQETTAIAGRSPFITPPTSPTVAASKTSCPNPTSVCASPSSSAASAPMRITFATMEFPSASKTLN
jgi:hypothetical protein